MNENLIERQCNLAARHMAGRDMDRHYPYHDWRHVMHVIRSVKELTRGIEIEDNHREDLLLAAIWHDAEFSQGQEQHEESSASLAEKNLRKEDLSEERIERVKRLILATDMCREPQSEDERIIRDADLAHLASDDYLSFYRRLFEEKNRVSEHGIDPEQWKEDCLQFMEAQTYFTKKGRELYAAKKAANIGRLVREGGGALLKGKKKSKKEKKDKGASEKNYRADKGIETMFRVSLRNHLNMSRIADDKANTLISVNAIILSIVLSALFPKLDSNPFLIYPGFTLLLVSILTIIMATFSTVPRTSKGALQVDDIKKRRGNLLFFGNFQELSLKDYEWGVQELMGDGDYLYRSLTRDLYFLGKVLDRKYRLLRYAYIIFVSGLIISIVLFVWSILTLETGLENTIVSP